jgi:uncharacterized protein
MNIRTPLLALFIATILSGCASTPPSRFYVLRPGTSAPATAVEPTALAETRIGIWRAIIPRYMDQPVIITRQSPVELVHSEYHRWGEPLSAHLSAVMAANLSRHLPAADVFVIRPDLKPAHYHVELEVLTLDGMLGEYVELSLRWRILDDTSRQELLGGRYAGRLALSDEEYATYVTAISEILDKAAAEMARTILQLPLANDAVSHANSQKPRKLHASRSDTEDYQINPIKT